MKKYVLITGVSTGIGYDAARELIANDCHVLGSVRRRADGERVQRELGEAFTPLYFDVTDAAAIAAAVPQVEAVVGTGGLAGLVNNAGIAPVGPLMHIPPEEFQRLMDTNVTGLLRVTQAFLPLLGARRGATQTPGRIVNISSISGGMTFPLVAAYSASKFAVEALSDGLRRELSIYGIHVALIEPGSIQTPIWDKAVSNLSERRYAQTDYASQMASMIEFSAGESRNGKPVGIVSAAIRDALLSPRPKLRYPLVVMWHLRKLIPMRLLDKMLCKNMGLKPLKG